MMLNSDNFGVMAFSISLVGAALLVGACRDRPDANVASTAFEVPGAMRKVQVDTGQEPGRKMIDISSAESLDALRQMPGIPELREWLAEVEERNKRNSGNFRQDP